MLLEIQPNSLFYNAEITQNKSLFVDNYGQGMDVSLGFKVRMMVPRWSKYTAGQQGGVVQACIVSKNHMTKMCVPYIPRS